MSKIFLILFIFIATGCGSLYKDKELAIFEADAASNKVIRAREIVYGIRVNENGNCNICNDMAHYFPINKNTINGGDNLLREFIKAYNRKNGTNFSTLISYNLTSVYQGELVPKGSLSGTLRGILLEIK